MTIENRTSLVSDIQAALEGAEDLLKAAAASSGEKAADLREKANLLIQQGRAKLRVAEEMVVEKSKAAARAADGYVHENPWTAIGVAAAVGFLLGMLTNRKN